MLARRDQLGATNCDLACQWKVRERVARGDQGGLPSLTNGIPSRALVGGLLFEKVGPRKGTR